MSDDRSPAPAWPDLPDCPVWGKHSYPSGHVALEHIRSKQRGHRPQGGRRKGWKPPHRAYRCPECGYWHLTKRKPYADYSTQNRKAKQRRIERRRRKRERREQRK